MDRLDAMSVFAAIVDGGSLSAAGRRLGLPLATVSRKLADLETYLGTRLITRSTRRLALTDAGRDYLEACRQILEQVDEAERSASGAYAQVKGRLVVAAPVVFGRLHMVPVVAAFLERHPEVDVQLRLSDRNVNLIEEHVDVALRIGALPDSSLVATTVGSVRRMVCASPSYLQRFGTPRSFDELASHGCVTFDGLDAGTAWTLVSHDGLRRQVPVHSRMTVSTADAAVVAASLGLGLTRVLSYQVADALRDGRLVRVLAADEPPAVPVNLVYPGQGRLPMKTRAFIDAAAGSLRERLREPDEAGGVGAAAQARPDVRGRPRRGTTIGP